MTRPFLAGGLLLFAAPAAAQVFLPGTQPGQLVEQLFAQSVCRICHGDYAGEAPYEPWDSWSGSMMAHSARDPLFWAAVDIANQDAPGVGEFCIRCHSPRGWLAGRSAVADGSGLLGNPASPGGDFEGVDCHFCHRMYEGPTGTPFLQNGQYWVDPGAVGVQSPMRGPFSDSGAPHPWVYSEYHRSSEFCAVCHDLGNPLVNLKDESGVDTGIPFPEQTTYTEWAASDYPAQGVECQTCHMPAGEGFACSDFFPLREEMPRHELAGANVWMLSAMKSLYGASLDREDSFDRGINLALEQLQQNSADLSLAVPSRLPGGGGVTARVRVVNRTGHKLPTGYPEGRRMWLHVLVQDGLGGTIYESGRYDEGAADLVDDADLRVYETSHGVHGEGATFHLVRNDRIFLDTRIPPLGFRPDARTAVVGATYATQPDGSLANWDDAAYAFAVPAEAPSPVTVTASLYYQTSSRSYIEFLRDENVSGPDPFDPAPDAPSRGEKIHSLWEATGRSAPILMRSVTRRIDLDRPAPTTGPAPGPPPVAVLRSPDPNPFRDGTTIEYSVPSAGRVRLTVFDIAGRRIRTLADVAAAPGTHRAAWDGKDEAGRPAATGSYFVRLEPEGSAPLVTRALLLR